MRRGLRRCAILPSLNYSLICSRCGLFSFRLWDDDGNHAEIYNIVKLKKWQLLNKSVWYHNNGAHGFGGA